MRDQPVRIGSTAGFKLPRDIVATVVPAGHKKMLTEGQRVTLMQALGGSATVTTDDGEMLRLSAEDSIDFGFVRPAAIAGSEGGLAGGAAGADVDFSVDQVWAAAATVYDPEIPVDIVELGLVYRVDAEPLADGGWRVEVDLSVTAPFCGMGDIMRQDLHDAVMALPAVDEATVQLVFDPPWDSSRMSDVARLELGMM